MSNDTRFPPFLQHPVSKAVFISTPDLRARGDLMPCWSADGVNVPPPVAPVIDSLPVLDAAPDAPAAEAAPEPEAAPAPAAPIRRPRRAAKDVAPAIPTPITLESGIPAEPPTPEQFANEVAAALAAAAAD